MPERPKAPCWPTREGKAYYGRRQEGTARLEVSPTRLEGKAYYRRGQEPTPNVLITPKARCGRPARGSVGPTSLMQEAGDGRIQRELMTIEMGL